MRHGPVLQRHRQRHRGPHQGRSRQGGGPGLRLFGLHQRLRRGQRGDHRYLHHPPHEEDRLLQGVRRVRGGHGLRGRPAAAPHHGRGGLRHGGDLGREVRRHHQGGRDTRPHLLSGHHRPGPDAGHQGPPERPAQGADAQGEGRDEGAGPPADPHPVPALYADLQRRHRHSRRLLDHHRHHRGGRASPGEPYELQGHL